MADVFISYAKADNQSHEISFIVDKLTSTTSPINPDTLITAWFDEKGIRKGEHWEKEIRFGLEQAHTIAIFISPRYFASMVCNQELEEAINLGKKLIPIWVDEVKADVVETQIDIRKNQGKETADLNIAMQNYLAIRDKQGIRLDFDNSKDKSSTLTEFVNAIFENAKLDDGAVEWLERALAKERKTGSWLSGNDLQQAEQWLKDAKATPNFKVLDKTSDYIVLSRKRHNRRLMLSSMSIIVGLIIISIFGLEAQTQSQKVDVERLYNESVRLSSAALEAYEDGDPWLALPLAIEAVQMAQPNPPGFAQSILAQVAYQPGIRQQFIGHTNEIHGMLLDSERQLLITGSVDETVKLWNASTGELLQSFEEESFQTSDIEHSPDGQLAIISGFDGRVILINLDQHENYQLIDGPVHSVTDISIHKDGDKVLSSIWDGSLVLWDIKTTEILNTFKGHKEWASSVAFSPDGKMFVSGSKDSTLILWDVETGEQIRTFVGHDEEITSVAFSPDGKTFVSASQDTSVILWDITSDEPIATFDDHISWVNSVKFSPDGKTILSGSHDQSIILWDVNTLDVKLHLRGHTEAVNTVVFSSDGNSIVSSALDDSVILWDITNGNQIKTIDGFDTFVISLALSSDNKQAVSAGCEQFNDRNQCNQGGWILWDLETGEEQLRDTSHTEAITHVIYSPNDKYIATASRDHSVKLSDAKTGELIDLFYHGARVQNIAFSPDSRFLFSAGRDNNISVWNIETRSQIHHFTGHDDWVLKLNISHDGQTIISGDSAGIIIIWSVETGKEIRRIKGHEGAITGVIFSLDGQQIISSSVDKTIILWDLETGREIRRFSGHTNWVNDIALSPDGQHILSASADNTLILWDIATGEAIRQFSGHDEVVFSVAFGKSGHMALSSSPDPTLIVWRLDTLDELLDWTHQNRLVREFTCGERQTYDILPLCSGSSS